MVEPSETERALFTAFEPSGDEHASKVIAELRRRRPGLEVVGFGGEKMAEAGARLIDSTVDDAAMGVPGLARIAQQLAYNREIGRWLDQNPIALHVPVDSPAANFPICQMTKEVGAKVAHLVAPQMWSWGAWRVKKLRRLTDHVLCVLPFEEEWFKARGVEATFIGHPVFDDPLDEAPEEEAFAELPAGERRVALLPGSRPSEIRKNFPILLDAFRQLRKGRAGLVGVASARTEAVAETLRVMARKSGGWPEGLGMVVGNVDRAIRWAEVVAAVSGTVTLRVARRRKPMVVVYRLNRITFELVGRRLLKSEHFALPNLIAGRRIAPELAPYYGSHPGRLAAELDRLLRDEDARRAQIAALDEVAGQFEGLTAVKRAVEVIEGMLGKREPEAEEVVVPKRRRAAVG